MTVTGIFQVGAQVDASVIFVHEQDARKLLQQTDRFQGMRLELAEPYGADEWIRQTGLQLLPDAKWRSWTDSMGTLFQAMRMEKVVVSLLLSVVIAVAAFNIVASLVLMVSDKRKDIAVLRPLGLPLARSCEYLWCRVWPWAVLVFWRVLFWAACWPILLVILSLYRDLAGVYIFDPTVYLISALPSKICSAISLWWWVVPLLLAF